MYIKYKQKKVTYNKLFYMIINILFIDIYRPNKNNRLLFFIEYYYY